VTRQGEGLALTYRFRLTVYSSKPGVFWWDAESAPVKLSKDKLLTLHPRDAKLLKEATKFHFEANGYASEADALAAGENLRAKLRILVCAFDLPLVVPLEDKKSATLAEEARAEIEGDRGIHVMDSRMGLWTLPDDETYLEYVVNGRISVHPKDPLYVLDAIGKTWEQDIELDERSRRALEIVSFSVATDSPKVKFLTTYLALEQLIPRRAPREEAATALIKELRDKITESELSEREKMGLMSALGKPEELSFSASFRDFVTKIRMPEGSDKSTWIELANRCIKLRNSIAHKMDRKNESKIPVLEKALRTLVMNLIWTNNDLEDMHFYRPGDVVEPEKMEFRLM
jgi:hypothetical protein